jgi:isoleucyl-tRNA synthetase
MSDATNVINEIPIIVDAECGDEISGLIPVKANFEQLSPDSTYSSHEAGVQAYWDVINLPALLKEKGGKPFNFMDGPPFVSGSLHYGHLAVGSYKSAVCNVMGMLGYDSSYILGFDCHGLPIESKVAKEHELSTTQIEEMGVANFNKLCDQMITDVSASWVPLFGKFGRLADFDAPYMTRDLNFMESTIWIFKQLYEKGLVYSGNKVMPYSHALETPLSNFEAGQNYQDVVTKSVYVRFEVRDALPFKTDVRGVQTHFVGQTHFVAWTTTPWTLPSNLALCVNADVDYVLVEDLEDTSIHYILSKNSLANLYGKKRVSKVNILGECKGSDLEGVHYVPVLPYMTDMNIVLGRDNADFFKVLCDPYVKDEGAGTSIVHQAPAFGEDDFRVCEKNGLVNNVTVDDYCPITSKCVYTEVVRDYADAFVLDADDRIRSDLMAAGHVIKVQEYSHSYPHCYRTDTPLVYRTVRSFFISLGPLKDRMIELNKTVTWHPEEVGSNRFGNWLENAKDWAVSRFRYYGTPIPIWINDEDPTDMICVGSIDELAELTGVDRMSIENLHPEFVNDLKIVRNGNTYSRVPDIFDCWFESGSVPFAQTHYPFDSEAVEKLEQSEFLSDFICEGLDQTRGWFYTLLVLSTAILDKAPYRNVVCTGMVLDEQGNKLSKRLKNYADPNVVLGEFGADMVRIYFVRSPLMRAEPLNFSTKNIHKLKNRFVPYINSFKFLIEHTLNFMSTNNVQVKWGRSYFDMEMGQTANLMDKWLLNRMIQIGQDVNRHVQEYRMGHAIDVLLESIEELTNWYLKLNRDRLKGSAGKFEQEASLSTLYTALLTYTQLWAPFTPFLSEYLFQRLKMLHVDASIVKVKSVLLTNYPTFLGSQIDTQTLKMMTDLQRVCQMVRNIRCGSDNHTSRMTPFRVCTISHGVAEYLDALRSEIATIQSELNVERFEFEPLAQNVEISVKVDHRAMGRAFRKESGPIQEFIRSQDATLLYSMYSGEDVKLEYNKEDGDTIVLEYPSPYFELVPVPKAELTDSKYTIVETDLMVQVDPTYDEDINYKYQARLLHSVMQKARKVMALRPWHNVTVMVDNKFVSANPDLITDLTKSLPNETTTLTPATFNASDLEGYEMSQPKTTDTSVIFVDEFEWNVLDGENEKGYFGVHYLKPE